MGLLLHLLLLLLLVVLVSSYSAPRAMFAFPYSGLSLLPSPRCVRPAGQTPGA